MYVIFLKFGPQRALAGRWMDEHLQWIQRGIDDGVFLLAGSLDDALGGALLAVDGDRAALMERVRQDPFVAHGVVVAELHRIAASRVAPRLAGLLGAAAATPA